MQFTVEQVDQLLYSSFLIIGPYKTGKTQSTATLHKLKTRPWVQGKKLYYYDFDEGCQPVIRVAKRENWADELKIFRYPRVGGEKIGENENVKRSSEPFKDFLTDINRLYDQLEPSGTRWKESFVADAPYAIVVDSLTAIQDDILSFTLGLRHKELGNAAVDGRQEYGMQMGKIVETIRSVRALPCFVVWLAHEQTKMGTVKMPSAPPGASQQTKTDLAPRTTGLIYKLPVVTGQLANQIGGEFGAVLFTTVNPITSTQADYMWITRPDGGEIRGAGTRLKEGLPQQVKQDFNLVVD